jgi:polyribonucleotide nucleotidyltransferase
MPDAYAALAASAALAVSNINFPDLISEVRVARIHGSFHINPKRATLEEADMDFIVAATLENVMMVEGEAKECSENDLIEAIKVAHEAIKVQIYAQQELAAKVGEKALVKRTLAEIPENLEVKDLVSGYAKDKIAAIARAASDKVSRKLAFDSVKKELKEALLTERGEEWFAEHQGFISSYYDKLKKETIRGIVLSDKVRLDGRGLADIRPIWCEVDYLPSAHGSSIFTRGETQSLTSLTLGTKSDEMMVDIAYALGYEKFILHYNFSWRGEA